MSMLHRLWTKAVGTPGYVKTEWQELERELLPPVYTEPPTREYLRVPVSDPRDYSVICVELANQGYVGVGTDANPTPSYVFVRNARP